MNDEESRYEELRWLAQDARQTRNRSIRRTAYWAAAAALVTGYFVANAPQTSQSDVPDEIEDRLRNVEIGMNGLLEAIGLMRESLEYDHDLIATLLRNVRREVDEMSGELSSHDTVVVARLDQINVALARGGANGSALTEYTVAKWLWVSDRPETPIWRWYPMKQGDTLWIPDGDYYVDLERIAPDRRTIDVLIHRGGIPAGDDNWPLRGVPIGREGQRVTVGNEIAHLYYAESQSLRPGFDGADGSPTQYVEIAICWSSTSADAASCESEGPESYRYR